MSFEDAWVLWLLPLALLPLLRAPGGAFANGWSALAPRDAASELLDKVLRALGALAVASLLLALAGPYRPEYAVERQGQGAEIMLVLDRSRSMDQRFAEAQRPPAAVRGTGPEALDYYTSRRPDRQPESKGKAARRLLAEFATRRPQDRFGVIVFSTLPIRVLAFTQKGAAVHAAIAAGDVGRGLSETHIGLALEAALSSFAERAYTGSRIVMLVSDGGDRLDPDTRERIAYLARKHRVALYWIYLRSTNSPGLTAQAGAPSTSSTGIDVAPEQALHAFFETLDTGYRAYEASDPAALKRAIDEVDRLENLPMTYQETMPRRELSGAVLGLGFGCVLVLLLANLAQVRRWA